MLATPRRVHPDDDRYKALIGSMRSCRWSASYPDVGTRTAIRKKGSGAVKNHAGARLQRFEVGRRHSLEVINIFDKDAHLIDTVPELSRARRFAARKRVVATRRAG